MLVYPPPDLLKEKVETIDCSAYQGKFTDAKPMPPLRPPGLQLLALPPEPFYYAFTPEALTTLWKWTSIPTTFAKQPNTEEGWEQLLDLKYQITVVKRIRKLLRRDKQLRVWL